MELEERVGWVVKVRKEDIDWLILILVRGFRKEDLGSNLLTDGRGS